MVDALILAGAPNNGALQESSSSEHEALIEIGPRPMVEYVIRSARAARNVGRIALVGPLEKMKSTLQDKPDFFVEMGDSLIYNLQEGLSVLDRDNLVLLLSADIPLITSEAIDDFVEQSLDRGNGDIFFPIISRQVCEAKFPDMKRTYARLKEGVYTGGNMALVKPQVIFDRDNELTQVVLYRKSTWKLSRLLGATFLFRFVLGKLSLKQIESRVSQATGLASMGIITEYAEVGFDVDKPSDLELATRIIAEEEEKEASRN